MAVGEVRYRSFETITLHEFDKDSNPDTVTSLLRSHRPTFPVCSLRYRWIYIDVSSRDICHRSTVARTCLLFFSLYRRTVSPHNHCLSRRRVTSFERLEGDSNLINIHTRFCIRKCPSVSTCCTVPLRKVTTILAVLLAVRLAVT